MEYYIKNNTNKKEENELKLNVYVLQYMLVTPDTSQLDKSAFIVVFSKNKKLRCVTNDMSQSFIGPYVACVPLPSAFTAINSSTAFLGSQSRSVEAVPEQPFGILAYASTPSSTLHNATKHNDTNELENNEPKR